jgi:hypothetical protein
MDKLQSKKLESIYQDQRFDAVIQLLESLLEKPETSVKGKDEFETIWGVAYREGRRSALNEFINELDKRLQ